MKQQKTIFAIKIFIVHVFFSLIIACSHKTTSNFDNLSDAALYQGGQDALMQGSYQKAIDHFKALEDRYPFGTFTTQAQLDLAYAYIKKDKYSSAYATASRFIRLHPNHPNIDYAHYLQSLAAYPPHNNILDKYLPSVSPSERDLEPIQKSFKHFSTFLSLYPQSVYAPEVRQRMLYLRNIVARHYFKIARFYFDRKAYVAAINRANMIIANYQGTTFVEPALAIMISSYHHLNIIKSMNETLLVLKKNFPNSKFLDTEGNFNGFKK